MQEWSCTSSLEGDNDYDPNNDEEIDAASDYVVHKIILFIYEIKRVYWQRIVGLGLLINETNKFKLKQICIVSYYVGPMKFFFCFEKNYTKKTKNGN